MTDIDYSKLFMKQRNAALLDALYENKPEIALQIIPHLRTVNFATAPSKFTPLHLAAELGMVEVVKALLAKGAYVTVQTKEDGYTPLHYALSRLGSNHELINNIKSAIKILVEHDPELVIEPDYSGSTPIHQAASNTQSFDLLQYFLSLPQFPISDVDIKDKLNCTPLHRAAKANNLKAVEFLLERGADSHALNTEGKTPLMMVPRWTSPTLSSLRETLEKHQAEYEVSHQQVLSDLDAGKRTPVIVSSYTLATQETVVEEADQTSGLASQLRSMCVIS